jgi:hypothetical protein
MTAEIWIGADDNEIPVNLLPQGVGVGDVVIWDKEPILIVAYAYEDKKWAVVRSWMAKRPDMHAKSHSTKTTPFIAIKAQAHN